MDIKESPILSGRDVHKQGSDQGDDDRSSLSSYDVQHGVKNIEAISQTWTTWALVAAYVGYVFRPLGEFLFCGLGAGLARCRCWSTPWLINGPFSIFLLAFFTSLESQTTINLTVYATSAFSTHSLVATVLVVQSVVNGECQLESVREATSNGYSCHQATYGQDCQCFWPP